jgi:hypothetical protein
MKLIATPAILENRVATLAIAPAARSPCFKRGGRTTRERTRRPPPQTRAAMRCNQSMISAALKSPASEA